MKLEKASLAVTLVVLMFGCTKEGAAFACFNDDVS